MSRLTYCLLKVQNIIKLKSLYKMNVYSSHSLVLSVILNSYCVSAWLDSFYAALLTLIIYLAESNCENYSGQTASPKLVLFSYS